MHFVLKSKIFINNFFRYCSNNSSLGVIGVPFRKGQKKYGVEQGPKILRENGLINSLGKISECLKIKDYGDLSYKLEEYCENLDNMLNYDDFISCNKVLNQKVQEILSKHDKYLVLGGDHSIAFGSISGHLACDPKITLIWVDAHADINLNISSPSGNIHGMPVSMLMTDFRKHWKNTNIEKIMKNYLPRQNLFYIGLRDIDDYESFLLQNLNFNVYGMNCVDRLGINKVLEEILNMADPDSKIHISFDVDGLDIKEAPSTGTPVPGGLTLREGIIIVETFAETNRLVGMDLVEINPCLGSERDTQCTVKAGIELVKAAFGHSRLGIPKDLNRN